MTSISQETMAIIKNSGYSVAEFAEACRLNQERFATPPQTSDLSEVTPEKDEHVFQVPVTVYPDGPVVGKATIRFYEPDACFVGIEIDGEEPIEPRLLHWPMPEKFKLATVYVKGKK